MLLSLWKKRRCPFPICAHISTVITYLGQSDEGSGEEESDDDYDSDEEGDSDEEDELDDSVCPPGCDLVTCKFFWLNMTAEVTGM